MTAGGNGRLVSFFDVTDFLRIFDLFGQEVSQQHRGCYAKYMLNGIFRDEMRPYEMYIHGGNGRY